MAEYIEREAAFNAILKLAPNVDDDGYCWVIRGDAATAIDKIPAADVQPVVRGKWIAVIRYMENTVVGWECSVCGFGIDISEDGFTYCPKCGADMRECET